MARGRLSPRIPVREARIAQIGQWMSGDFPDAAGTIGEEASAHG
jgi:simple sugar transport system ATP-binding protein